MIKNEDLKFLAMSLPQEVDIYRASGDFYGEIECIKRWQKRDLPECVQKRLELELIIATRLLSDYTIDDKEMLDIIKGKYPSADEKTLDQLISFGNIDFIMKNGKRYFQNGAPRNALNIHHRFLYSVQNPGQTEEKSLDKEFEINHRIMKEKGSRAFRFEVEESLTPVNCDEMEGKKIRVWLPYPSECKSQSEIELISSSHPVKIEPDIMRSAYIETEYHPGDTYTVRYKYVNRAKYVELSDDEVEQSQPDFYTSEQLPQISFTPTLKALAREIVGDETNPLRKARKIYDWITHNVQYSYLRSYFCIPCIPEYVALNRYGDCGAMSLLFITLCRIVGIPAKWQSGNSARPTGMGSHDWCLFYIAPYGWLYCDPSYGEGASRSGNEEKRNHYFGNLDPFRCVTCDDFQLEFYHPMKYLGMDPYDNQNGEAEFEDRSLTDDDCIISKKILSAEEID